MRSGDRVTLRVIHEVRVDGLVVIMAGAEAWGHVDQGAVEPRRFLRSGAFKVSLEGARAINGEAVPLEGSIAGDVGSLYCDQACALTLLMGAPLIRGPNAIAPRGLAIIASVALDQGFDRISIEQFPSIPAEPEELRSARERGRGLLHLYRLEDDGCRGTTQTLMSPPRPAGCGKVTISVDGELVANIRNAYRLTVELTPGEHTLLVGKTETLITVDVGKEQYVRVRASAWKRNVALDAMSATDAAEESVAFDSETLVVGRVGNIDVGTAVVPR